MMKVPVLLLIFAVLLTGCSSLSTRTAPKTDLSSYHHFFVESRLADNHRIADQIVAELQGFGLDASSGPLTMLPDDADAIITYQDRWTWDFKSYLIDLDIEVHTARTIKPLAEGHYHQASMLTKPAADVIREILAPMFKRG